MEGTKVNWLIGLGNPGRGYAATRHNVGFLVVEELARRQAVSWRRSWRFSVRTSRLLLDDGREASLAEPLAFMNRSGEAVGPLLRKRGVPASVVALVFDDVDLPLGRIRVRPGGSAGGHRGVRSVLAQLGTEAVPRIRVGVGKETGRDTAEHVLGRFRPEEQTAVEETVARAADAAWCLLNEGVESAMNRFNRVEREQREEK